MIPTSLRLAALVVIATTACTGKYVRPTSQETFEAFPERLARGKYLVNTIGACGACHTGRSEGNLVAPEDPDKELGGGNWLEDGATGLYVPNISSDPETGLGAWSDDEILRAIRDGVSRDGHFLFPIMPFGSYQHMSDEDARSIVVYLRTVPAAKPVLAKRDNVLPFPVGFILGRGGMAHLPVSDVKAPSKDDKVAWGGYVARLGHCGDCHSFSGTGTRAETDRWMAGSDAPFSFKGVGKVWASNLTPDPETGLGRYDAVKLKAALRSGMRLDGKQMAPPMSVLMPHFALASEEDVDALVAWLGSLAPVKYAVPPRQLEPEFAKLVGEAQ